MNSRPGSSLGMRLTSPPPSKALLDLQKQGLELALSSSPNRLQVAPSRASGRSTPSDLDKPLPLEPFEAKKRRSSSVYSFDRGSQYSTDTTTITNILRLYSDYRELDDVPPMPVLHQPQAYRDTVAPLLVKRLGLSQSPSPQPLLKDMPREAISSPSLRSVAAASHATPTTKPSFTEFSRQLQMRRDQLVSPLSDSSDLHRQAAYDQLAPPSPQVSSVELSISVSQTPPLPDAMSVSISDAGDSGFLPSPLEMSNSSLPHTDWEQPVEFDPARHQDQQQLFGHSKSWSQNWLKNDGFVTKSPDASPVENPIGSPLPLKERERVISYAEAKYPGMKRSSSGPKKGHNSSARSSVQQGVGNLLRSLSRKSAVDNFPSEWPIGPQRQLAIPKTPYQVYGPQIFDDGFHKKQRNQAEKEAQEAQLRRRRTKSISLASAYQNGQTGLVNAVRKLTRKSSQKRQRKLKDSIIVLGPSETKKTVNWMKRFSVEADDSWI